MNSNELFSLQQLVVSVNGLKQSVEANSLSLIYYSSSNNDSLSSYHNVFGKLIKKYTGFAEEYKYELNNFHKLLSNKLQQLTNEQLRKLETMSNCSSCSNINDINSSDIVDNSDNIDYSSADISFKPSPQSPPSMNKRKTEESDQETPRSQSPPRSPPSPQQTKPVLIQKETSIKVNKVPVEAPKLKQPKKNNITRKFAKPNEGNKGNKNNAKSQHKMINKKVQKKMVEKKVEKVEKVETAKEEKENEINNVYKYDANKIGFISKFEQYGERRSSTLIFVGNLNKNVKIAAIQFFVMKKCHITMRQIEQVTIKNGLKSNNALVRIRSDVSLTKINKFINERNDKNSKDRQDNKKNSYLSTKKNNKNKKSKNNKDKKENDDKKQLNTQNQNGAKSWQRKIYLNLNDTFKYFETEQEMYSDPYAKCTLFVRNFDVLNKKCHKELTYKFLEFGGELKNDIVIKTDYYNDPYAMVTFKNIDDAIYCCNSRISFYGRVLEMKYDQYSKQ